VDIATRPSDFDRMTDSALYTARSSLILLCNRRIERLGDRSKNLDIVIYHRNRFTEILVPLNMCRNTDLMDDGGNIRIKIFRLRDWYDGGLSCSCRRCDGTTTAN